MGNDFRLLPTFTLVYLNNQSFSLFHWFLRELINCKLSQNVMKNDEVVIVVVIVCVISIIPGKEAEIHSFRKKISLKIMKKTPSKRKITNFNFSSQE